MTLTRALLVLLLVLGAVALGHGPAPLSPAEVALGLFGLGSAEQSLIVQQIRLPRVLLAWLLGAALGAAGAALQGLFRNPLAEPGLLGINASAGLGAVTVLYFGAANHPWLPPLAAMLGAAGALGALDALTRAGASTATLLLAGVALSALAAALTALALNLAPDPAAVQDLLLWLLGSVSDRSFVDVALCLPGVMLGLALLVLSARALDILTLGEAEAHSLGVDLTRLRQHVIAGTALSVGACVAVTGPVGFVGLVVPHLLRRFVAYRPSALLLPSALGGAALVQAADLLVRALDTPRELMLGVVTALLGAPFLLALTLRSLARGA